MSDIAEPTAPAEDADTKPVGKVRVTQIGSPIGRKPYQKKNLIGLGLNKMHRSRVLENTPEVQGMITRVSHLLKVEVVDGGES